MAQVDHDLQLGHFGEKAWGESRFKAVAEMLKDC